MRAQTPGRNQPTAGVSQIVSFQLEMLWVLPLALVARFHDPKTVMQVLVPDHVAEHMDEPHPQLLVLVVAVVVVAGIEGHHPAARPNRRVQDWKLFLCGL